MEESKRNLGKQLAITFKLIGATFSVAWKNANLNITIEQFIIINAIGRNQNITQNELVQFSTKLGLVF